MMRSTPKETMRIQWKKEQERCKRKKTVGRGFGQKIEGQTVEPTVSRRRRFAAVSVTYAPSYDVKASHIDRALLVGWLAGWIAGCCFCCSDVIVILDCDLI